MGIHLGVHEGCLIPGLHALEDLPLRHFLGVPIWIRDDECSRFEIIVSCRTIFSCSDSAGVHATAHELSAKLQANKVGYGRVEEQFLHLV